VSRFHEGEIDLESFQQLSCFCQYKKSSSCIACSISLGSNDLGLELNLSVDQRHLEVLNDLPAEPFRNCRLILFMTMCVVACTDSPEI
jgi:hypothetical protein